MEKPEIYRIFIFKEDKLNKKELSILIDLLEISGIFYMIHEQK